MKNCATTLFLGLLSAFLFSVPSRAMHRALITASGSLSKTAHVSIPRTHTTQQRTLFGCRCINEFKPEVGKQLYFNPNAIDKRIKQLSQLQEIAKSNELLESEGTWPVHVRESLKQELLSGKYCTNFACCTKRVDNKELRAIGSMWGIASIFAAATLSGAINGPIICVAVWPTAYSWLSKINAEWYREILTDIAEKDLEHLAPVCTPFQTERTTLLTVSKSEKSSSQSLYKKELL